MLVVRYIANVRRLSQYVLAKVPIATDNQEQGTSTIDRKACYSTPSKIPRIGVSTRPKVLLNPSRDVDKSPFNGLPHINGRTPSLTLWIALCKEADRLASQVLELLTLVWELETTQQTSKITLFWNKLEKSVVQLKSEWLELETRASGMLSDGEDWSSLLQLSKNGFSSALKEEDKALAASLESIVQKERDKICIWSREARIRRFLWELVSQRVRSSIDTLEQELKAGVRELPSQSEAGRNSAGNALSSIHTLEGEVKSGAHEPLSQSQAAPASDFVSVRQSSERDDAVAADQMSNLVAENVYLLRGEEKEPTTRDESSGQVDKSTGEAGRPVPTPHFSMTNHTDKVESRIVAPCLNRMTNHEDETRMLLMHYGSALRTAIKMSYANEDMELWKSLKVPEHIDFLVELLNEAMASSAEKESLIQSMKRTHAADIAELAKLKCFLALDTARAEAQACKVSNLEKIITDLDAKVANSELRMGGLEEFIRLENGLQEQMQTERRMRDDEISRLKDDLGSERRQSSSFQKLVAERERVISEMSERKRLDAKRISELQSEKDKLANTLESVRKAKDEIISTKDKVIAGLLDQQKLDKKNRDAVSEELTAERANADTLREKVKKSQFQTKAAAVGSVLLGMLLL